MELLVTLAIIAVVVWYFGSALASTGDTINKVMEGANTMAKDHMTVYVASSKKTAIDEMADIDIDEDKIAKAKANIEALKSIEL